MKWCSRAQSSMEYMMVVGLVAVMVIPATFIFYSYASDSASEIDSAQIDKFGRDVVSTAETIYYLGAPSRIVLEERLPKNVKSISVDQDPVSGTYLLAIAASSKSGIVNVTFPTRVRISGDFGPEALSPGIKSVKIYAGPNINNNPFVVINLENSSCESNTLLHLRCSATKPRYCFNGVLISNCNECGCSAGPCQKDGSCGAPPPPPTIISLNKLSGFAICGTSVTISGTGFAATPSVTFGGVASPSVTFVSSNELTVVTPAHATGAVDVRVTNPDGQFATLSGGFTYTTSPPPTP